MCSQETGPSVELWPRDNEGENPAVEEPSRGVGPAEEHEPECKKGPVNPIVAGPINQETVGHVKPTRVSLHSCVALGKYT